VGQYEPFQATMSIQTTATNYSWPYDPNPPASIPAGTGITVNALFSNDNWATTTTVPCFYYQGYNRSLINGFEAIAPSGNPSWMVRFSPLSTGTWQFVIQATDASGTTTSPAAGACEFNCVTSTSEGFLGVSPTDSRYFQLSDGTPIVSPGINAQFRSTFDADTKMQQYGSNGIKIVRWWLNYRGYQNPFSGGDSPVGGGPQWNFTLHMAAQGGHKAGDRYCAYVNSGQDTNQTVYLTAGTNYRFAGFIKTQGVIGRDLGRGGTGVTPYIGSTIGSPVTGTNGWTSFSVSFNPSTSGCYKVGVRHTGTAGTGLFDDLFLSDGSSQANYLSKSNFDWENYMDPLEAWKADHIFQTAKDNGVYLKTVITEKQDDCLGCINPDGTCNSSDGTTDSELDENVYSSEGYPTRWLQQAWWRYIIARWGAYTSVHSWEYCNEADPFDSMDYDAANALAGYMHTNDPYGHLSTISFWHSVPTQFWYNSQCDYIDAHEYIGPIEPGTISNGPRFYAWYDPNTNADDTSIMPLATAQESMSIDTSDSHSGSQCYQVVVPDGATNSSNNWAYGPEYHVGVVPFHTYTLTYWAKATNINNLGGGYAWEMPKVDISWSKAYHQNDYVGGTAVNANVGTYGWTQFTQTGISVPSPAGTANIAVNCPIGPSGVGNGTFLVDDIQFIDEQTGENLFVDGSFEGGRIDYDTALAIQKYGVLLNSFGKAVSKPAILGETGVRGDDVFGTPYEGYTYSEENQQLLDDTTGIYLKDMIWAHILPHNPYMLLWWTAPVIKNNLWGYFGAYQAFMSGIPLSNGNYVDAQAVTSVPNLRAWGQKDVVNGRAHLWIDNIPYTWYNVVNGVAVAPVSGTVTIPGLPNGEYTVQWWNTASGSIIQSNTVECTGGVITLTVTSLGSDIACQVQPLGTATAAASTTNPISVGKDIKVRGVGHRA
jgi:hypothetical protein